MTHNPFLQLDQQITGNIYTATDVMDNLTILCDDFGSRFGGTEGERLAAEFLKEKMESYGLEGVTLEPVEFTGWHRGEARLDILEPVQKSIPCISLPHSPPADIEGVIIDMDEGVPDDFERRAEEIRGNIVLTSSLVSPGGVKRWIHRKEKLGRSLLAGATGFIFVNHYPGYGPATGGIGQEGQPALIPGISVALEDGAFIQRLIKRKGKVKVRLTTTDSSEPMVSWNVVGELPGKSLKDQVVMIGCHYDGHDISQGATDPASGVVAVLEAARVLAKYAAPLPCTVRFVFWGIEEIGLLGSKAYVRKHDADLDRVRFYLNMDAAGSVENKGIVLNEWPELEPLFARWRDEMALEFEIGQSVNAHSDHFPFLQAGVPTGGMERVKKSLAGRGYGHTHYDTLDKANLASLREAAMMSARILLRAASEETWPVGRRDKKAVATILDNPDNREASELTTRVAAFYEKHR